MFAFALIFIQSCEVPLYLFYIIGTKAQRGEIICSRSVNQYSGGEGIRMEVSPIPEFVFFHLAEVTEEE